MRGKSLGIGALDLQVHALGSGPGIPAAAFKETTLGTRSRRPISFGVDPPVRGLCLWPEAGPRHRVYRFNRRVQTWILLLNFESSVSL